jgi:signal transduction histidine kinase/DNA-binding NarL/FixJ family response regulator
MAKETEMTKPKRTGIVLYSGLLFCLLLFIFSAGDLLADEPSHLTSDDGRFEHTVLKNSGGFMWFGILLLLTLLGYALFHWRVRAIILQKLQLEKQVAEQTRELRRSETRYRELVDTMNSVVAVYVPTDDGNDFIFREFNQCGERTEGIKREEVIGNRLTEVFPGSREFGVLDVFRRVWESGKPEYFPPSFYKDAYRKGWRENYIYKLPSDELVAVYDDVTDRILKQEEILKAKEAAEAANRAKSAFLTTMSHELRTPLNGILGYTEILINDASLNAKQREGLKIIDQSGKHLFSLINEILDLAKVESGKIELFETEIHLPGFLRSIGEVIRVKAEQQGIEFCPEFSDNIPVCVRSDERRLRQILLNLLGNAVKFTDKGKVILRVSSLLPDEGGDSSRRTIHFEVEDTGIGISAEDMEKIFEPFQQAGDAKDRAKGTGLGLAISRSLLKAMGGSLALESQPGSGSIFRFDLELPEVGHGKYKSGEAKQKIIGIKGAGVPKILIVDDKAANRGVFRDMLEPLGFETAAAEDASEGLAKAEVFQPDAVIADLIMPETDGFELIRRIRRHPLLKDTVIIASSASVCEDEYRKSKEAGADAFLPKPLKPVRLFELLQNFLKIEWLYESAASYSLSAGDSEGHVPPAEILEKLLDFAVIGDVEEILNVLDGLIQADEAFMPFAETVEGFAKKFELGEITRFVENCMAQAEHAADRKETEIIIPPPEEELERLHSVAILGLMERIEEQAAVLENADPRYIPFANKLKTFARDFEDEKLAEFIEQYRGTGSADRKSL